MTTKTKAKAKTKTKTTTKPATKTTRKRKMASPPPYPGEAKPATAAAPAAPSKADVAARAAQGAKARAPGLRAKGRKAAASAAATKRQAAPKERPTSSRGIEPGKGMDAKAGKGLLDAKPTIFKTDRGSLRIYAVGFRRTSKGEKSEMPARVAIAGQPAHGNVDQARDWLCKQFKSHDAFADWASKLGTNGTALNHPAYKGWEKSVVSTIRLS